MQESTNNTQELDNSSFSLKQKQLDIIKNNNPAEDNYHTWIRSIDDIKTFEETLQDNDYKEYYEAGEDFDETYSAEMAKEALETGRIMVYSSYPIKQGVFVSPSRMEAGSYSGNGKVYSKEVKLTDVAWIDPTQGQYAEVDNIRYSTNNKQWQEYLEENFESKGTKTDFKQMKLPTVKDIKKVLNPNEISKLKLEDANTTPILKNTKVDTGKGKSKFTKNILDKTNMLNEESKKIILNDKDVNFYKEVTNKESLEKAYERLKKNGKSETENWLLKNSENASSVDVAEGWILLKQYQDNIAKETDISKKR